jgi:hypothetical protein
MTNIQQVKKMVSQAYIYLEKAYRDNGATPNQARASVSSDLIELSQAYFKDIPLRGKPGALALLETAMKQADVLGTKGAALKNTLVSIKKTLEAKH